MYLNFESRPQNKCDIDIPILQHPKCITPDIVVDGVKVDGIGVDIDQLVIKSFVLAVAKISSETLQPKHFRDCNHFVMAMSGLWMPTHPPFARDYLVEMECSHNTTRQFNGPVALGIPNDGRCLGFGNQTFVYTHSVFGIETSVGNLCLSKLGVGEEYSLSTYDTALKEYELEIAHPVDSFTVKHHGEDVFRWLR